MTDTVKPSEVIRLALDKYLNTRDQWCTGREAGGPGGTYYENDDVVGIPLNSPLYSTRCGAGALKAAAIDLGLWAVNATNPYLGAVSKIEEVLAEQNPEFLSAGVAGRLNHVDIPFFNDGIGAITNVANMIVHDPIPSVGYEGIKSAFEKAAINLEESGE